MNTLQKTTTAATETREKGEKKAFSQGNFHKGTEVFVMAMYNTQLVFSEKLGHKNADVSIIHQVI